MALSKFTLTALRVISAMAADLEKVYKFERAAKQLKSPPLANKYKDKNREIFCDGRKVVTRVYTPEYDRGRDLLLFFHGGGWVTENIDTYNGVCSNLARRTHCKVVSVEYKLAPENPFPDGLLDCYAAAKEIILHSDRRVTLIGDSAGGNLAAAVSLMARDKGELSVERQILLYPALYNRYDESSPFESVRINGNGYLLTAQRMQDYMELYKSKPEDLKNSYFAPMLAGDFKNQPNTLVITSEFDPLRDEGEYYGKLLKRDGAKVKIFRMRDALHGFLSLGYQNPYVKRAHQLINDFLYEY